MHAAEITQLSGSLVRDGAGIWHARSVGASSPPLDFPEGGHAACLELEDRSFWFEHRNACILHALRRHPFEGPLLDVGGGNGAVSSYLEAHGISTVLVEPGAQGARNARARGLERVVCARLDDANFHEGSFHAVGAFDVIEHVDDDRGLLRSMRRVLARDGLLAVTVPAYRWLWSAEDEEAGHHRRYTRQSLRRALEAAGFEVCYETYFFAALVGPVFFARSLRHRLLRTSAARSAEDITRTASGHHLPSNATRRLVDAILGPERTRIAGGGSIPIGTSCLALAVKSSP